MLSREIRKTTTLVFSIVMASLFAVLSCFQVTTQSWADENNWQKSQEAIANKLSSQGSEIVQVSLGLWHSGAVTADGSLWMWGGNDWGQIGDGTTTDRSTPVKIMENVKSVSLGSGFSAAIKNDGSLWMWGNNDYGMLGTIGPHYSPIKVLDGVAQVSLGADHVAAITNDGALFMWGRCNYGKIGDGVTEGAGSTRFISTPIQIMSNVAQVSLGENGSAAVTKEGLLYTWGGNITGDGTKGAKSSPTLVMDEVASVSLGATYTLALKKDGTLLGWGTNQNGELGIEEEGNFYSPVVILDDVIATSVSAWGPGSSTAIKSDGSLWTWGWNNYSQLAQGGLYVVTPGKVMEGVAFATIGFWHSAAIDNNGELWMWGSNGSGQLGNGSDKSSSRPVRISLADTLFETRDVVLQLYCGVPVVNYYGNDDVTQGMLIPTDKAREIADTQFTTFDNLIKSVESSDPSIVNVDNFQHSDDLGNVYNNYNIYAKDRTGAATVTVVDMYDNVYTSTVTVDNGSLIDASTIGFSSHEKELKVGDALTGEDLFNLYSDTTPRFSYNYLWLVSSDTSVLEYTAGSTAPVLTAKKPGKVTLFLLFTPWNDSPEPVQCDTMTVTVVDPDAPATVPVESVEVTPVSQQIELKEGETANFSLTAKVLPAEANDKSLAWSSSNEDVAVVDESGKVTVVALGDAVITATAKDGSGAFGTCALTVVEKIVPATKVSVSGEVSGMKAGETRQFSAQVEPADSTDKVVWSSSDTTVVTVDQTGLVTAVGNGSATITVTAGDVSDSTDAIEVTTAVSGVSLDSDSLELFVGSDGSKLQATVAPATASNQAVNWTSSDENVAKVDGEGKVTPVAPGSVTITATTEDGDFSATCAVTVKQHVEGIALDKTKASIAGAGTIVLKATVEPDNATNKNVIWTSSDESVATVDQAGVVTAVGKGEATIKATSEESGQSAACIVVVNNPAIGVSVEPTSLNLIKGEDANLVAVLSGELAGETDGAQFAWFSSDESVATVEADGLVSAKKTGSATITVQAEADLLATCTVEVTNPVKTVTLSETTKTMTVGVDEAFMLSAAIDPIDGDGADKIAWASSNKDVATVSVDGTVTIKQVGSAIITASSGGKSASCALVVNPLVVQSEVGNSGFAVSVEVSDPALARELKKAQDDGSLSLVVDRIDALTGPAKNAIDALAAAGNTITETFDIYFVKGDGEEIALNGKDGTTTITVKVKMTDAMKALDPASLKVHFVGDDGTIEDKMTWTDGEYLYFTTEHFSTYVVTGKPRPQGNGAESAGTSDSRTLPAGGNTLVPTGDVTGLFVVSVAGLAAVCALLVGAARRRMR